MSINEMIKQKQKKYLRKKVRTADIWDVELLASDIGAIPTSELAFQNDCYGAATVLKKYAGISNEVRFNFVMEHGSYMIKNYAYVRDIIHNAPIVTFGEARKKMLEQEWNKTAYAVGPYIAYAEDYYSKEKFGEIKSKYGRVLLVFPSHSTDMAVAEYSFKDLVSEIDRVKREKGFDTIMICLHWMDIAREVEKEYIKAGYQVVCAGRGEDELFLSRLKAIINLSDGVMMNDVGTSLAYALYLRKPCYIYKQDVAYGKVVYAMSDEYFRLLKAFENDDFQLTDEQLELCDYIYGFGEVKKKDELKQFILEHSKGSKE